MAGRVEQHVTIGADPHPVPPTRHEPITGAVRSPSGEHCEGVRVGRGGRVSSCIEHNKIHTGQMYLLTPEELITHNCYILAPSEVGDCCD